MREIDEFNQQVAQMVRDVMAEHHVSQERVANLLGRSQSYVSQRTSGRAHLSIDIVAAVAHLAHIPAHALLARCAGHAPSDEVHP